MINRILEFLESLALQTSSQSVPVHEPHQNYYGTDEEAVEDDFQVPPAHVAPRLVALANIVRGPTTIVKSHDFTRFNPPAFTGTYPKVVPM